MFISLLFFFVKYFNVWHICLPCSLKKVSSTLECQLWKQVCVFNLLMSYFLGVKECLVHDRKLHKYLLNEWTPRWNYIKIPHVSLSGDSLFNKPATDGLSSRTKPSFSRCLTFQTIFFIHAVVVHKFPHYSEGYGTLFL